MKKNTQADEKHLAHSPEQKKTNKHTHIQTKEM
jgi:hypothetical protein